MSSNRKLLTVLSLFLLASLACSLFSSQPQTPQPPVETAAVETVPPVETEQPAPTESQAGAPTNAPTTPPASENVYPPSFADYPAVSVSLPASAPSGYSLPVGLSTVKIADAVQLTPEQRALLEQNGFVVTAPAEGAYKEFYQVYEIGRYNLDQPIFVTTDSVFHIYHLIFDKMLRDMETEYFIPTLEQLTQVMLQASQQQAQELQGTSLEEPALRNLAFFAVADQLLGLSDPVPTSVQDLVQSELALIEAHGGVDFSPIWDRTDLPDDKKLREDYSQYIPRGHYTRSEALQRYFRAMMWYGRLSYRLRDPFETRRALLITHALRTAQTDEGQPVVTLWQRIYEPTVFIVGKADDLSYFEYGALADQIFGSDHPASAYADDASLEQFRQAARQLPPPQVNSMWVWIWEDKEEATQGFRFMGQRFTLDEYVFGQLIWREVGTTNNPRGLPKALDFFAALGSEEALSLLQDMGETDYENYMDQMEKVRGEINELGLDSWTQNLYWSWLYAFFPMIEPKGEVYPAFMRTQAWTRKDLQTALGSWTELKHDTILYAKQVMAEMGGGAPDEPPHGYVEPNPEAFARLNALAQMTKDGLLSRGLLSDLTRGNLDNLIDMLGFLQRVAEIELAGGQPSDEDYWRIQYFGGELEALTIAASDCDQGDPGMCRDLSDQKAALVADVATGIKPDGSLVVLEEAIGQPAPIYVVLPDQPYRLGLGAVFMYYEFEVAPGERMTDETWQGLVENGTVPPQPDWTNAFIAP